ncbi:968_t:CDS:2 [Acaulospora colombiana]|uniref:968_t:CDS:1 n=1 Tax=Acaulospora colombiana TaxID=27376 RepID=A0ACA9NSV2_9GLOM|nr:968_t:CDS:2 [Acaulospora colombiana]
MTDNLVEFTADIDLKKLTEEHKNTAIILDFWAAWAQPCEQMNEVFAELAKKHASLKFIKIEAEKFPETSESFEIVAVPSFIVLKNGKVVDRVDGANASELTSTVEKHAKTTTFKPTPAQPREAPKVDLNTRLKELVNTDSVMVFIKGTPSQPRCGFTRQLVEILNENNVKFSSFNILTDEEVRQELIGGLDIVKEMIATGSFKEKLPKGKDLDERLQELTTKSKLVIFIKGSPDAPRCGFTSILDGKKAKYEYFDILRDDEVREGLKTFAKWPTYPMVFNNGELIGGLDIIKELDSNGELDSIIGTEVSA